MLNIIFFTIMHFLLSTHILEGIVFFTINLTIYFFNCRHPDDNMIINWIIVCTNQFLLLFIRISFLIYMNKICKKSSLLGKFFEKLKNSLIFRIKILCLAVLVDCIMLVKLTPDIDNMMTFILPLYFGCGTGMLLSYISLYAYFDLPILINFLRNKNIITYKFFVKYTHSILFFVILMCIIISKSTLFNFIISLFLG